MDNDPLSNLPPETRQRVRDALHAFGGAFQDVTVSSATHSTHTSRHQEHSDRVWAHWEYSAEEWALFDQIDWQAARRVYWLPNIVGTVAYLLVVAVLALLFQSSTSGLVLMVAFILLVILFLIFVLRIRSYSEAMKRHQARQSQGQAHTVTFSKDGVWEAGIHFPLHGILMNLLKVKLTFQPTVLHFRRELLHLRQSNEYDTLRVLVPSGHEEEAARLMQRFQIEVIEASKKPYNPPEPV